jgi:hypothetical protein
MASNSDIAHKSWPDAEFRFFIYDPEGAGFMYFRSAEDRDQASEDVIQQYLDDGWDESVEQVVAGEISHTCQQVNREERPAAEELDEEGYDGEGTYWGDFDYRCNYALRQVVGEDGGA